MDPLDQKYAFSVLKRLTEKDIYMKSELFDIVKSNQTLDKLVDFLAEGGYITKKLSTYGRRTYSISLTAKGRIVADNLKHIEEPRITVRLREEHEVVLKLLEKPMTLGELEKISKGITGVVRTLKEIGLVKEEISHGTTKMRNVIELTETGREVAELLTRMRGVLGSVK